MLVDPTGHISACNDAARAAFGAAPGEPIDVLFPASGDPGLAAREIVPRAVREGKWAGELPVLWGSAKGPARGVVFGHRAPEGELFAVSVICEDPDPAPADTLADIAAGALSLPAALRRALGAARALTAVHRHGLVHRDVQARSFVLGDAEEDVRITGLSAARPLAPGVLPPREVTAGIEGALEYLSPELTGRVNRAVDRRSDLYSLGVVLYELLSGRLPLQAGDPLEWVHCHVARVPDSLHLHAPAVPEAVDRLVMRLLAKNPDDRYQSAAGVMADLDRCLGELRDTGKIDPFPLGERDVSDVFAVPQKLYGRTAERDVLHAALARVGATQRRGLAFVAGAAGIGKSSLVQALREPAAQARGAFVSGKFDGVARDVPYAPFAQAIGELVQQALAEPPGRLQEWRTQLRAAVGVNGAIICDLVPRAELLLGACPPVAELPLSEAERRVHRVVGDVLDVFAAEHPVVLFVDDLQWADPATVQLIVDLDARESPARLLLVGAYRDDELDVAHPLTLALQELRASGAPPLEIELRPLDVAALQRLLDDTLHGPAVASRSLAALVRDKTGGTPYFVLQFLHTLHRRGRITLDLELGGWRWDRAEIAAEHVTDNVVDMLTQRLRRLPDETQALLTTAACLGDRCDLHTLAVASGREEHAVERELWDALRERLLVAREPGYRFSHDRVQQAAYALIPADERPGIHLRIARLLLAKADPDGLDASVFAIVGHFNRGRALLEDPDERLRCAQLNLRAGQRAMNAAALRSAARYLRIGIELLPDDCWEAEPRLSLDLHLASARCEHAGGDAAECERLIGLLLAHAAEPLDVAAAAHLRVETLLARSQAGEAAEAGVEALGRLGFTVDPDPSQETTQAAWDSIQEQLGGRPIESLLDLPPSDDPRVIAATSILGPVMTSAFLAARQELGVLLMMEGVRLSLAHGNAPVSPLLHALLGSMIGARFGQYEEGRRLMHAAHALVEGMQADALAAQTGIYVGSGSSWTDSYEACLPYMRAGRDYGMRVGDVAHVAFCAQHVVDFRFAAGEPLDDVLRECDAQLPFADEMQLPDHRDAISIVERAVRSLRGETDRLGSYEDGTFDDEAYQERWRTVRLPYFHALDWSHRCQVRVIAHQPGEALRAAEQFDDLVWAVAYNPVLGLQEVWGALARTIAWGDVPSARRPELRDRVAVSVDQLEAWAQHAPGNFLAQARLVAAELARIDGRNDDAVLGYEQAIESARVHGRPQLEALAWELNGRHHLGRGFTAIGLACLREAREGWVRWGAHGKVAALDEEFPALARGGAPENAPAGLDMLAVTRSSQAISGELELDELPATLLRIAVAAAGAQSGRLLLVDGDRLDVVAVAEADRDEVHVRRPADADDGVPKSVTDYVVRTGERVLLRDARADPTFGSDAAIRDRGARSLLCQPILRHGGLVGLLLLEHGLVDNAFTEDRLAAVEILAAQAAISVETARLYQDVREENRIRRRTEAELRASEEQFRTLVESAPDAIVIADERGRIVLVNSRVEQLFGHARDTLEGRLAEDLVGEIDWAGAAGAAEGTASLELERTGRRRDGAAFPVEVTLSPLERPSGGSWTIGIVRDVTERKRLEHELEHAADHDALTGLFNRPRFERELASALERVERSSSAAVLLVLDLDHIRDINDSLGPQVGDELIRALALALRERLRPTDVLARLGGDEYAFILSRTDVQGAMVVADELLELVRHHALVSDGVRVRTTASIGIAPITATSGNAQDLLAAADVALDQAKERGRDRAVVYTPDSGRRAAARHTWSERVRHALEHEQFTLHAQPIVDLRTGEATHAELLIRLQDDGQLIPPAEFLPTAERTGLITAIDRWVIHQGTRLAATSGGRTLELNLSAKSLADPDLPVYIEREVDAAGADPATLVFEITETAAIANLPSAAALAERLTALGCHFALDDFGVGFGSFYYLKRLPLHYIKIDGDFIQTLTRSPTDQHVTKAIVDVAQGMGLKTIAEFVEDAETLELLRSYGVDYAQGFHVGRPGPVEDAPS